MSDLEGELTPGLASRAVRGGSQLLAVRLGERLLGAARHLGCAALLGPREFGHFAVAGLLLTALDALTEPGTRSALLRRKEVDADVLDAAWTLNALRGLVAGGLIFGLAGPTASYFGSSSSAPFIRVIALVVIIRAFQSPRFILLERELRFRSTSRLALLRAGTAFAVAIGVAIATGSAWSLVVGALAAEVVTLVGSYLVAPARPRVAPNVQEWRELARFGRWVTLSSILVYGIVNVDDVVVGRLLGPALLAQYQVAYLLSNSAATEISLVINRVLLPSLSRSQDRLAALRSSFAQAFEVTASLATGLAAVIAVAGGPLLIGALGEDWAPAAGVVWILSAWGALRAIGASTSPALFAVGRPELVTTFHLAMLIPIVILVVPATDQFGLRGAAAAIAAPNVVVLAIRLPRVARALGFAGSDLLHRLVAPLCGVVSAVALGSLVRVLVHAPHLAEGAMAAAAAAVAFIAALHVTDRMLGGTAWSSLRRAVQLLRGTG